MNRLFIIIPPVLLFFVFIFFNHQFRVEEKEKHDQQVAKKEADEKAEAERKKKLDDQAREEARLRQEAADREEQARQDKVKRDRDERERLLKESTDRYVTTGRGYQAEIARLQKDLEAARIARDKAAGDALDLSLDVERSRIAKRAADNEIQRLTEMIEIRMKNSTFTQAPVAVTPPATK